MVPLRDSRPDPGPDLGLDLGPGRAPGLRPGRGPGQGVAAILPLSLSPRVPCLLSSAARTLRMLTAVERSTESWLEVAEPLDILQPWMDWWLTGSVTTSCSWLHLLLMSSLPVAGESPPAMSR